MSINEQMKTSVENYLSSDKLTEVINENAESMINDIVKSAFGWNGVIKEQCEEAIKEAININTKDLGLLGHNKFLTEIIAKKLKVGIRQEVEDKINKEMDAILKPIEKVVPIKTLINKLVDAADKDDLRGDYGYDFDPEDSESLIDYFGIDEIVTFIVEPSSNSWVDIYMDKEPNKEQHECEFNLTVHKTFTNFKIRNRDLHAIDKIMNYQFDIEDLIYQMFLGESSISYEEALNWDGN